MGVSLGDKMTEQRKLTGEFLEDITPWSYAKNDTNNNKPAPSDDSSSLSNLHDGRVVNGEFVKTHGISWPLATLFLIGQVGGAMVALPTAVQQCGFYNGLAICALMACVLTATAIQIGKAWAILPRNWEEYRTFCRKPYAEIGYRALGTKAKTLVSVCLNVTQFGICVVYLLLSAKNIHDFISNFTSHSPGLCLMIIIIGLFLLPITFLKSPEDFWWAIVAGMCSTGIAVILIIVGMIRDHDVCAPRASEPDFHILNFFTALGAIMFAFAGHSTYPTIQHDMRRPHEFSRSAILAIIVICAVYTPLVTLAHIVYGDSLRDSILNSIQTVWIQQAVNLMIAAHCMLAVTLVFNPLNQEAEELFKVPQEFGVKRVILRSGMMVAVIFVAESIPNFGPLLNLIGGSLFTLSCVIFPPVFYLFLRAREEKIKEKGDDSPATLKEMVSMTDKKILFLCSFIILIGLIGGGAATFSAAREIISTHFELPCYVKPFINQHQQQQSTSINCCGAEQNVAVGGDTSVCNAPDLNFYG